MTFERRWFTRVGNTFPTWVGDAFPGELEARGLAVRCPYCDDEGRVGGCPSCGKRKPLTLDQLIMRLLAVAVDHPEAGRAPVGIRGNVEITYRGGVVRIDDDDAEA